MGKYIIDRFNYNEFDDGFPFTVTDEEIKREKTSLTFIGRGAREFDDVLAENFLHLLENFTGENPPSKPITGQLWFRSHPTEDHLRHLYVWNGDNWKPLLVSNSKEYIVNDTYMTFDTVEDIDENKHETIFMEVDGDNILTLSSNKFELISEDERSSNFQKIVPGITLTKNQTNNSINSGDLIPLEKDAYDLGNSEFYWNELHVHNLNLTGGTIVLTNPDIFKNKSSVTFSKGDETNRPENPEEGQIRYNTKTGRFETYKRINANKKEWSSIGSYPERIKRPVISYPKDKDKDVRLLPTIVGSVYNSLYSKEKREYRELQIDKKIGDYSNPEYTKREDRDEIKVNTTLEKNTEYKLRIRDVSIRGNASNWTEHEFVTTDIFIKKPRVIGIEGSPDNIPTNPKIDSSEFSVSNGNDTHKTSDWQIERKKDNIVIWKSNNDENNLESIKIPDGNLSPGERYRVRVRYIGDTYGTSKWSNWFDFSIREDTQAQMFKEIDNGENQNDIHEFNIISNNSENSYSNIMTPEIIYIEGETNNVPSEPLIKSNGFKTVSGQDGHVSSDWEIKNIEINEIVVTSRNDYNNLTAILFDSLNEDTHYAVRVRYEGGKFGKSNWSEWKEFTTGKFRIAKPSITYIEGSPMHVPLNPKFESSHFESINVYDKHVYTDWQIKDENNKTVWEEYNSDELTSISFDDELLNYNTYYKIRVRHNGKIYGKSKWSEWKQFYTKNET